MKDFSQHFPKAWHSNGGTIILNNNDYYKMVVLVEMGSLGKVGSWGEMGG